MLQGLFTRGKPEAGAARAQTGDNGSAGGPEAAGLRLSFNLSSFPFLFSLALMAIQWFPGHMSRRARKRQRPWNGSMS